MALKDKKLDPSFRPDEKVASAVRGAVKDGCLACAAAFAAACTLGVDPRLVGRTADSLAVHLSECQLGLFGFPGHAKGWEKAGTAGQPVPEELEKALVGKDAASAEISCAALWKLAADFGVSRMLTGFLADKRGLKIRPCQLGAF
jgi:hypothetical protein